MKWKPLVILYGCLFLLMSLCGCAAQKGLVEKSGEWDRIIHDEYVVENCTWNIQAVKSKWQETIFCDTLTESYGWRWDFSGEKDESHSFVIKTFPEIIFGRKPYENYTSTTTRLPGAITSVQVRLAYEYAAHADGIYNTTTDISFTDSKDPGPANIRAKLMIWLDRRQMPFFDSTSLKRAVIGGQQHKVFINKEHIGPEGKWVFIALLPEQFPSRAELNLNEYFNYLLAEGALQPEWFLSSIEVGSEIASGRGEIIFKQFKVKTDTPGK